MNRPGSNRAVCWFAIAVVAAGCARGIWTVQAVPRYWDNREPVALREAMFDRPWECAQHYEYLMDVLWREGHTELGDAWCIAVAHCLTYSDRTTAALERDLERDCPDSASASMVEQVTLRRRGCWLHLQTLPDLLGALAEAEEPVWDWTPVELAAELVDRHGLMRRADVQAVVTSVLGRRWRQAPSVVSTPPPLGSDGGLERARKRLEALSRAASRG
ncbi:MAG: hypothetical protein AB7O97_11990 [Planctomycetota bacterium]